MTSPILAAAQPTAEAAAAVAQTRRAELKRLILYWDRLRADRVAPEKRQIDPAELGELLPNVWLAEREGDIGQVRFRLAGERIRELHGRNLRHVAFDVVFSGEALSWAVRRVNLVLDTPAITHSIGLLYDNGRTSVRGERIVLPLAKDGVLQLVLGAAYYDWHGPRDAEVGIAQPEQQSLIPLA